jgi:RNA polymerase sigma factor (sigma-70 family)
MSNAAFETTQLRSLVARLRAGDQAARDEIIRACQGRLEALAARLLRKQSGVRRWTETGDVFNTAAVKLLRALERTDVTDTRAFFGLAAVIIRRELIGLARHLLGPHGVGAKHASGAGYDPVAPADDPADVERMAAFHTAVEELPVAEREVFGLVFYQRWTQREIADLLGISERMVRKYHRRAVDALIAALGGELPDE